MASAVNVLAILREKFSGEGNINDVKREDRKLASVIISLLISHDSGGEIEAEKYEEFNVIFFNYIKVSFIL